MMPPSGRAAKPTPRVAKEARVPVTGIGPGEECGAEVQCGSGAEADEVVGLDHGAHTGADGNAPGVLGAVDRTAHGQSIFAHGGSLSKSGCQEVGRCRLLTNDTSQCDLASCLTVNSQL